MTQPAVRLSRRPRPEQLAVTLHLAVLRGKNQAAFDRRGPMGPYRETYWYAGGQWWLVLPRTERAVLRAHQWAIDLSLSSGPADDEQEAQIVIHLLRLQRVGMRAVARLRRGGGGA